jgi:hypothetical protein
MAIKSMPTGGSGLNSKGGGAAKGALTGFMAGGPIGAALGAASSLLPNSPGKSAFGAVQMASDLGGQLGSGNKLVGEPKVIENDVYDPMKTRLDQIGNDPMHATNQALAALNDPSVPDYVRSTYAEPLLRYKYFGKNGGIA